MHSNTFLIASVMALSFPSALAYSLVDDYMSNNYADFFGKFTFWTDTDTTFGFVDYVSENDAWTMGLIGNGGNIYMGVDDKTSNTANGRASTRLTSTQVYQSGTLIVADISHMPGGVCGTWPAFWTTSATSLWPQEGEIDIIEQANSAQNNQMSLHVSNKQGACNINSNPSMKAKKDRWVDCTQEDNGGCDANDPLDNSWGSIFNQDNGGVYGMEWTSTYIRVYFFPRGQIPSGNSGPLGNNPDPSTWGIPTTSFEGGGCNFDNHVKNQRIIINTDLCGTWANGSWQSSGCAGSTGVDTCEEYVRDNPEAFTDAFWTFNTLKVYQ